MMAEPNEFDAVVVGSGPNGLAAAIHLAQHRQSVLVVEAKSTVGGGARSAELTLPGFVHDVCSAIHPLGKASPFFSRLPLEQHGVEWVDPPAPLAHPLDDGSAVIVERSVEETARDLGRDSSPYRRLMSPLVRNWDLLAEQLLGPPRLPRHPFALAQFGLRAMRSASGLATGLFDAERARAAFAGCAAHSILPLERPLTASFGLILGGSAHAVGWPLPAGGSQRLADGLASYFRSLGGVIETNRPVTSFEELDGAGVVLFDTTPRQVVSIAGSHLPPGYRRRLTRFRYGPGVFKLDLALDGPIPWKAEECARAGTVHVGGTLNEIAESEQAPHRNLHAEKPFVLVAQQSLFDSSRAPLGKQAVWAYCHVPNGSTVDMSDPILSQIERFAPGFRDRIVARSTMSSVDLEEYNGNYIGGDISAGAHTGLQLLARPVLRLNPYSTPNPRIFICSASTPPGAGVHGMCGYFAARAALRRLRRR